MTLSHAAKPGTPVILGVPFDANSSWLRGAAGAPPIIRAALTCDASNSWTETGVDLSAEGAYCDAGDLKFAFGCEDAAFAAIETKVGELLDQGLRPVCLGGDHSITLPIIRAFGKRVPDSPSSTSTLTPISMTNLKATGCHMRAHLPESWKRARPNV